MPTVVARGDTLNELNANFAQVPLRTPAFMNSVPKCGTHLMRNIVRMFVPVEQQYHKTFIQHPVLRQHLAAFSPNAPKLSWGHLLFSDDAAIALRHVKHTVLVRDPYDWVLARARFFLSENFQGSLEHLKNGNVAVDEVLNMMILGIHEKAPTLQEIFLHNAIAWLGTKAEIIRFEDLIANLKRLDSDDAEEFFGDLLAKCGIEALPKDWRERVRIGSDRKQSGTARENLSGRIPGMPDELPEIQKRIVNHAAPGLRELLGYN
ncbi:MAG: hypothetical protein OEW68_09320 [Gammaproteobacteria bacterium]|nr:hypothetical protein [Gammaproteobacteria bacterium]MDH4315027.1 hypothetical protein [Gammaproteobacteria bacterium]